MDQNDTEPAPQKSLLDQIRSGNPREQADALAFIIGARVEHVDGDYCPICDCPICECDAAGLPRCTPPTMYVTGVSGNKLTVAKDFVPQEVPLVGWRNEFTGPHCNATDPNAPGSRCTLPRGHELDDFDVTTIPKEHRFELDVERILRPEKRQGIDPEKLLRELGDMRDRRARHKASATDRLEQWIIEREIGLVVALMVAVESALTDPSRELAATPPVDTNALTPEKVAQAAREMTTVWLAVGPGPERTAVIHLVDLIVSKFMELPDNSTGGRLHVVLDDTNIQTRMIRSCARNAQQHGDDAAYAVAGLLLAMTFEERQKLATNCDCGCLPTVDEV